jgi:hypothetical protein
MTPASVTDRYGYQTLEWTRRTKMYTMQEAMARERIRDARRAAAARHVVAEAVAVRRSRRASRVSRSHRERRASQAAVSNA